MDYVGIREDVDLIQHRLSLKAYEVAGWGDYLYAYRLQRLQGEAIDFFNDLLDRIPTTGKR